MKKKLQTLIASAIVAVVAVVPVFANVTGLMTSTSTTMTTSVTDPQPIVTDPQPIVTDPEPIMPEQKLPAYFFDLKDGLKAGTDYNGITVGEDMKAKETLVETKFQLDGETYTSLYLVQGSNNAKEASGSNAKGGVPATGAFVKVVPEKNGVFTVVVHQSNAKPVYFVKSDASGTATLVENFTTVANEVIVKEYTVKKGETYYFYASGSKVMIGAIGIKYDEKEDEFVAVKDITGVPTEAVAGESLTLKGTVTPDNATNKTIKWSIRDAGATGATLSGSSLKTTKAGKVVVTATVEKGLSAEKAFTKDFTIDVKEKTTPPVDEFVAVKDITGVPTEMTAGEKITLKGTVTPDNATNKTIKWSVKDAGETGAKLSGAELTAENAGKVTITATIAKGASAEKDFTKDFTIDVKAKAEPVMLGDVDGNGKITAEDALAVLKHVVGSEQEAYVAEAADVDKNGKITAEDALAILKHVVGSELIK